MSEAANKYKRKLSCWNEQLKSITNVHLFHIIMFLQYHLIAKKFLRRLIDNCIGRTSRCFQRQPNSDFCELSIRTANFVSSASWQRLLWAQHPNSDFCELSIRTATSESLASEQQLLWAQYPNSNFCELSIRTATSVSSASEQQLLWAQHPRSDFCELNIRTATSVSSASEQQLIWAQHLRSNFCQLSIRRATPAEHSEHYPLFCSKTKTEFMLFDHSPQTILILKNAIMKQTI